MPIIRSADQPGLTLEEFYGELRDGTDPVVALRARAMLILLDALNALFAETTLYGLTSLDRLVIQHAENWDSPWFVIVTGGLLGDEYSLEYLLPEALAPWPAARVHGDAPKLEDALTYVLIAMRESGGWKGNEELARGLQERNLGS